MNISELRDLKLTMEEWDTLVHPEPFRIDLKIVDMLVLAGLVEWDIGEHARDEGEWLLTDKGRSARDAIDMIFDWTQFAHREDKPVEEQDSGAQLMLQPPGVAERRREVALSGARHAPSLTSAPPLPSPARQAAL